MRLISNHIESHKSEIKLLFENADEVIIAVAFLKYSGLKILIRPIKKILKKGGEVKVFCGLSFFQTDPSALKELMKLHEMHQRFTLKVIEPHHGTFHPKLYYSKKGKKIEVIIGSANLTSGGLVGNDELSILNHGKVNSDLYVKIFNYFNYLQSKSYPSFRQETLEKYEKRFNVYKKEKKKQEQQANEDLLELSHFTTDSNRRIGNHLGLYWMLTDLSKDEYSFRITNYAEAKKLILKISKGGLTKSEFEDQYSKLLYLFFSTGLHRSKRNVVNNYKKVIDLFSKIVSSKKSEASEAVKESIKTISTIPGMGINILTEILHALNNSQYPIINNRSIGALRHLGFNIKKNPFYYTYKDYQLFKNITSHIVREHNLENYGRLDHLLHTIYVWNQKTEKFDGKIPEGNNVFIKPVGHAGNPYPERCFDKGICHVDFTYRASFDSIKPDDILVIYGVGSNKIITVAIAMSKLWQRVPFNPRNPSPGKVWPKSVYIQNLTPAYGQSWWTHDFELGLLERNYLKKNPDGVMTAVGGKSLGARKRGSDKIKLDKGFGQYLLDKIMHQEFA